MNTRPTESQGPSSVEGHWNDLTTLERVKMILENAGHFLFYGLVTRQELDQVMAASESGLEYMTESHPEVLFSSINIGKEISTQALRNELKTALSAVFLSSK